MDEFANMNEAEFLAFMTFAASGGSCPCCDDGDECGTSSATPNGDGQREAMANEMSKAVEHLGKRKSEELPVFEDPKRLCIRQQRELVKRECGFSIWRLTFPLTEGEDPIVEQRSNHRIVFVKQLSKVREICIMCLESALFP